MDSIRENARLVLTPHGLSSLVLISSRRGLDLKSGVVHGLFLDIRNGFIHIEYVSQS